MAPKNFLILFLLAACDEQGAFTVVGPGTADSDVLVDDSDDTVSTDSDTPEPDSDPPVDPPDTEPQPTGTDADGDGRTEDEDCDDQDPSIFPGAEERCNQVDDNCDGDADEGDACPCPTETRFGGFYLFCDTSFSWEEAQQACQSVGQALVVIDTRAENQFIQARAASYAGEPWWIGLSDQDEEGTWLWTDGSSLGFTQWNIGEPNNLGEEDCAELRPFDGLWNDIPCEYEKPFICELP